MKILLCGGFSGGHIIPLIRLKEYYESKYENLEFYYLGFSGYLEEKIVSKTNIKFLSLKRKSNRLGFYLSRDILTQIDLKLHDLNIDVVISTGGGHSFHIIKYVKSKKIPYYLIEENIVLGFVNKYGLNKCKKLYSPFKYKHKKYQKAINPSCYINKYKNINEKEEYDFLFIGGSLGSDIISNLAIKMRNLPYKCCLICGNKYEKYKKYKNNNLDILPYQNLIEYYNKSKTVVTRAGSSTLFELISLNKKIIMIPSLKTRKNHQVLNALYFKDNNLALYLDEHDISVKNLLEINQLYIKPDSINNYLDTLDFKPYDEIIESFKQ